MKRITNILHNLVLFALSATGLESMAQTTAPVSNSCVAGHRVYLQGDVSFSSSISNDTSCRGTVAFGPHKGAPLNYQNWWINLSEGDTVSLTLTGVQNETVAAAIIDFDTGEAALDLGDGIGDSNRSVTLTATHSADLYVEVSSAPGVISSYTASIDRGSDTGGGQFTEPGLSSDTLTLPVVTLFDQAFRLVFNVVSNGPLVDLVLVDFAELIGADTSGAPSFFGGLLSLPELVLDGASFWGEFVLVSDNPVTFRLSAADVNKPGASGVEGKWRITETVNAEQCDEGTTTEVYELQVMQQGNQLSINSPAGTFDGALNGTSLRWSGSIPEDGGTVTTSIDVTFTTTLDRLSGSSSWSWTDGSFSCAGTSQISGILLHN